MVISSVEVSHRMLMGVVETASPMVEVMRPRGQRLFGKDGSLNMDGIGGGSRGAFVATL